jgi:hypothetical protein
VKPNLGLLVALSFAAAAAAAGLAVAKETKAELKADLRDNEVVGDWIYDDIDAGLVQAVREKKPVCIVFR